jgi:hypothetical protein
MKATVLDRSGRKARTVHTSTIGKVCHKAGFAAPLAWLGIQVGALANMRVGRSNERFSVAIPKKS